MQLILLFSIVIPLSFGQPIQLGSSVVHQPATSIYSIRSSPLLNHPKRKQSIPLLNHLNRKTSANNLAFEFEEYRRKLVQKRQKTNFMDITKNIKKFVHGEDLSLLVDKFYPIDLRPETLLSTIHGDRIDILKLMRIADPNVDFTIQNTNALVLEAIQNKYYSVLEYICQWALETSHMETLEYIYKESKTRDLQLEKIFTLNVRKLANQLKEKGFYKGYDFQKGIFRKRSHYLRDAITSKSDNELQLLLSSGKFSRDDIISALFDVIIRKNPFLLRMSSIQQEYIPRLIVSSMSLNTIATIMNHSHAQQVLHSEDFSCLFIELVLQSRLKDIHLNEAAQSKIIRGLAETDGAFVRNFFQGGKFFIRPGAEFPLSIDLIMRSGHISRDYLLECIMNDLEFTFNAQHSKITRNLLYSTHVQNILNDMDFVEIFFKAIDNRELYILHFLKERQEFKTRIIQGIYSFGNRKYVKAVINKALVEQMSDAISLFGDSKIIPRKDVLHYLMSVPHTPFYLMSVPYSTFVSGNDDSVVKVILTNKGFISVLTETDLESVLQKFIQKKQFRLILELELNPIFFDRISAKVLEKIKWKIQGIMIDRWDVKLENQRQLVVTALDEIINKRV